MLVTVSLQAQNDTLKGLVINVSDQSPLIGAVVFWEGTETATATDINGEFNLKKHSNSQILIVNYLGYSTKKIEINEEVDIVIELNNDNSLNEVEITIEKPTTRIDFYNTIKLEEISQKGLEKAACCNLSESFETNPTVDASFTDAVTGTKQIQLLGLSGPYAVITTGNIPTVVGNSAVTGLDFIPGQWLESIQLIKGTGSVVNGNQSIAGQINAEFKDPNNSKLFLNIFGNQGSRLELNLIKGFKLNTNLSSGLFIQADNTFVPMDNNNDGFIDNQLGPKVVAMSTWKFKSDSSNWEVHSGLKFDFLDKQAGQQLTSEHPYLFKNQQERIEFWSKLGYLFNAPGKSLGMQFLTVSDHKQLTFGNNLLRGQHNQFYYNLIFNDIINNTNHSYKAGVNYVLDDLNNRYGDIGYNWTTNQIGGFLEYTLKASPKFSLVSGARLDYNSKWGTVFTPRVHGRLELTKNDVLRFSGGMGTKNPNPFFENIGVFASSRTINLSENIKQEQAWNYGINYTRKIKVKTKPITFSMDLYRTDFTNKLIVNLDENSKAVSFYNLENSSYANSFMSQIISQPAKWFETTIAYRFYDVQTKYSNDGFLRNPLSPAQRLFFNGETKITKNLILDLTAAWNGKSRIPSTEENSNEWQLSKWSESFWLLNGQIKYTPKAKWTIYFGGENLLHFKQPNPILAPENPFGNDFDASLVWGPVFGRNLYGGIKYNL